MQKATIAGFTSSERDYIRRELGQFFSTLPSVADGFQIKTWRGGPRPQQSGEFMLFGHVPRDDREHSRERRKRDERRQRRGDEHEQQQKNRMQHA